MGHLSQVRRSSIRGRWDHRALAAAALTLAVAATRLACGADLYDAAVAKPGRPPDDLKRDVTEHPAELLRLAGIRPGMTVADILAGGGYYTELMSAIVGPNGKVVCINNAAWEKWSPGLANRLAGNRLANVEHRTAELEAMGLGPASLDAAILVKVYHDMYWIDPEGTWPKVDVNAVLTQIARALKPNGTLLLVDHSAKAGSATRGARIHRIDEAYAVKDIEAHGFRLVKHSDILKRPDDARDETTFEGPMVGRTDRFVLVFRKTR